VGWSLLDAYMARIIYAVAGEGFGHASRAHLIGQRLIDAGHDVMFVASQKSLVYLRQYFGEKVKEIFGLGFYYERGYVEPLATIKKNLFAFPRGHTLNKRLFKQHFEPFGPDLVITDFEPFSGWWAWRHGVPFISIDHEHFLVMCKLEHKLRNTFSRLNGTVVARCHYVGASTYIVINFFRVPVKKSCVVLAPPIIRPIVTSLKPSHGEHIIVYSSIGTQEEQLLEVLQSFGNYRFLVYGFNKNEQKKNCTFKKRSTEGFLTDLANARGVVAFAGSSLISECMYLKKKMLMLPLAGQYEQIINAQYIEKLGLGRSAHQLNKDVLSRFLSRLDEPMPKDDRIIWPDNEKFFQTFQSVLNGLDKPIKC